MLVQRRRRRLESWPLLSSSHSLTGGEGLGGWGMICIAMEALGGAQPCCCYLPAASICTQAIVITQITHGVQGQYSTVPIPSLRLIYKHSVYYPTKYGQTFPLVDNQILYSDNNQKPNSWTYNFVEVSGHKLESSIQNVYITNQIQTTFARGGGGV
jgi:hypothetical protein